MLFHNFLSSVVGSKARAKVLERLLAFPSKEYTGRELAHYAGVSQPQAALVLKSFRENGLVELRGAGSAHMWKLNERHAMVKFLKPLGEPLGEARKILLETLKESLDFRKVERIVLFGSVARGNERPSSDIDLLVVVKNGNYKLQAKEKLLSLSVGLAPVFGGNPLIPVIYSATEANQKKNTALFKNIEKEGIHIYTTGGEK